MVEPIEKEEILERIQLLTLLELERICDAVYLPYTSPISPNLRPCLEIELCTKILKWQDLGLSEPINCIFGSSIELQIAPPQRCCSIL